MIGTLIAFAVQAAVSYNQAKTPGRDVKDILTNPRDGLQTRAHADLAEVIRLYEEINAAGQNNGAVAQETINAIEHIRAAFEAAVLSWGPAFSKTVGAAGIKTINDVTAKLIADRRAEIDAMGPAGRAAAAAIGTGGANLGLVVFVVVVVIAIATWR